MGGVLNMRCHFCDAPLKGDVVKFTVWEETHFTTYEETHGYCQHCRKLISERREVK